MSRIARSRLIAAVALLACAPSWAAESPDLQTGFAAYVSDAEAIVAALDSGSPPQSQQSALTALADRAAGLVAPFSVQHPVCRDYLAGAMGLRDRWSTLSLERIEADYHHDAALPRIANAGDQGLCYQMKDLLVHPLTALRLLREPVVDRATLSHEITEVVAHGRALQALSAAKTAGG